MPGNDPISRLALVDAGALLGGPGGTSHRPPSIFLRSPTMWPGISHASSGTLGQQRTKLGGNEWRGMESRRRVRPTWRLSPPDDSRGFATSARVLLVVARESGPCSCQVSRREEIAINIWLPRDKRPLSVLVGFAAYQRANISGQGEEGWETGRPWDPILPANRPRHGGEEMTAWSVGIREKTIFTMRIMGESRWGGPGQYHTADVAGGTR